MQETATGNFFRWSHGKSWYGSVFLRCIWFTHLISTTRLTGKEMFVSIHLHFTYVKWKADMTSLHARIRGQGKGTLVQNHAHMQMFLDLLRALGSEARCARSRSRCWATGGASGVGFTVPATDGLHWDGVASRSPETSVAQRVRDGGDPSYGTLTFGNLIML